MLPSKSIRDQGVAFFSRYDRRFRVKRKVNIPGGALPSLLVSWYDIVSWQEIYPGVLMGSMMIMCVADGQTSVTYVRRGTPQIVTPPVASGAGPRRRYAASRPIRHRVPQPPPGGPRPTTAASGTALDRKRQWHPFRPPTHWRGCGPVGQRLSNHWRQGKQVRREQRRIGCHGAHPFLRHRGVQAICELPRHAHAATNCMAAANSTAIWRQASGEGGLAFAAARGIG